MTLVEFIEARYAEAEQEAVRGYYSDTHWRLFTTTAHLKAWVAWREYFPREQWDATANDAVADAAVAGIRERITAHEADRIAHVLREVEAKRRILHNLATHAERDEGPTAIISPESRALISHTRWHLRMLALPFADHPEYNESWRV